MVNSEMFPIAVVPLMHVGIVVALGVTSALESPYSSHHSGIGIRRITSGAIRQEFVWKIPDCLRGKCERDIIPWGPNCDPINRSARGLGHWISEPWFGLGMEGEE